MSYEILIILFILLSVISSIFNKLKESRRKQVEDEERPSRRTPPYRRPPVYRSDEEEEIDLSEWEVLPDFERRQVEPVEREFREVRGTRRVEETDTGREFQEVQVTRPVTETAPVAPSSPPPSEPDLPAEEPQRFPRPGRKRRKIRLDFKQDTVRKAILYNEILGPPRGEQMPF